MSEAADTSIVAAAPPARASLTVGDDGRARCAWSGNDDEYRRYHDDEWGRALRDDRRLFEKISLEGFQAGLSWITILRRREAFRSAFDGFDVARVAAFTSADVDRLVLDASIIRHRGKIEAVISNARATLALDRPLSEVLWQFAPSPGQRPKTLSDVPATTDASTAMSKALRKLGFRFVGPTTMYALMQSTGMVDDHVVGCFRAELADGTALPR